MQNETGGQEEADNKIRRGEETRRAIVVELRSREYWLVRGGRDRIYIVTIDIG
jgi:hypothetical protein